MNNLTPEQLQWLFQSAVLAPSADNKHPIVFQTSNQDILVHHTRTEWGEQGYKRVLDLLSLGALAENLSIAASRFGMETDIALLPDLARPDLALQITLGAGAVQPDPLWQAIPLRHTNRKIYFRGPRLNKNEQIDLTDAIRPQPTCKLHWLDTTPARKHALSLMRRAEAERFHNPVLHEELFSAIRFDVGWRNTCEEGLPPGALGVEPPLRGLFSLLRHWGVMRLANRVGTHHLLSWRSCYLPCRLAPHVGLLSVKKADNASVFATGRAFQRLWLMATRQGRVLQPLPASALYALEGVESESIPAALQNTLAAGWRAQAGERVPLILFRMGRASPPLISAGRLWPEIYLDGLKSP